MIAWIFGGLVLSGLVLSAMGADFDALTIPEIAVSQALSWGTFAAALYLVSIRVGSGDLLADYRVAFRPIDLLALPAGVAGQLLFVPVLYRPLQRWWPDTFSDDELEERALELVGRASGATTVLLVVVVVIGAPFFEELVYRGLLQRSVSGVIGRWWGWILASAWFSLIHFAPANYPGLFAAGLLFGACLLLTDRLGPAVLAHLAFNATGLAIAFNAS